MGGSGILKLCLTFAAAYLLGSISFAVILSKTAGRDVRNLGSGNAGSTNMLRNFGVKWALLTFAGDFLKGTLAVYIAGLLNAGSANLSIIREITVIFVLLGHMKPVFFNFKGGKGVATALGALVMLAPKEFLFIFVIGISMAAITGYVSLAATSLAFLYPFITMLGFHLRGQELNIPYIAVAFIIGAMILYSHRENIKRLINHQENSIYKKRS